MADVKISEATPIGILDPTDMLPIARAGSPTAYNATLQEVAIYVTVLASQHPPEMAADNPAAGSMDQYSRADHVHPTDLSRAPIDSPEFVGSPKAPLAPVNDSSQSLANTQFVARALLIDGPHAPLDSPQFIGTPRAPTPGIDDQTDLIATTEYFQNQGSTVQPTMNGQSNPGVSRRWSREDHVHPPDPTQLVDAPSDGKTYGRVGLTARALPTDGEPVAQTTMVWTAVLPASGGVLNGPLTVSRYEIIDGGTTGPAQMFLDTAVGGQRMIAGRSAGATRWIVMPGDPTAETGSNAGANFAVTRFSDAGTLIDNPLTISRATGVTDFSKAPTVAGTALAPLPSTTTPTMNGAAAVGTGTTWARADHTHPTDTSRAAVSAIPAASSTIPAMNGAAAIGVGTTWARADHVHSVDASRMPIVGTTTNDNALAGQVGEYQGVQRLSTNGVTLTSGVDASLTSLVLTAGDWDVWGSVGFTLTNNNVSVLGAWINPTGTVAPSIDQMGGNAYEPIGNNSPRAVVPITPMRVSVATSTTVTLGTNTTFNSGTHVAWGKLMARRAR